jgi:hypothetical protein
LACSAGFSALAQANPDSVKVRQHNPKKATLYSAVLPGAGTIYNRKNYWKIPIVYGALGTGTFFIVSNHIAHKRYKNELIYRINNNGAIGDSRLDRFSDDNLFTLQDQYRRWRDLSVVVTAGLYVIQIVDATVDAHFVSFDVSDNLSFRPRPIFYSGLSGICTAPGIQIRFTPTRYSGVSSRPPGYRAKRPLLRG